MMLAPASLVVVTLVHLVTQVAQPGGAVADLSQVLLMPALGWVLLERTHRPRVRLVRLTLLALGFSWLGDTLPRLASDDLSFLVMVGCFLLAQFAYIAALLPRWRDSVLSRRPIIVLPYAAVLVALVALCHAGAGSLLVPVVIYGSALTTMAILATGLGWIGGVGGAVFLVSDALIALHAFADLTLPAHGLWVMLTYVAGQALLVAAVLRVATASRAPGAPGATAPSIGSPRRSATPRPGASPTVT